MKICFLVPWITKGRGGTENVGQMMANAMAARGHDVHIITFDNMCGPSRWPLSETITLHHVAEAPGVSGTPQELQLLLTLASLTPDLVVGLHMNRAFLGYVRAVRKLGVPLVLSEHQDPQFPARLGTFDPAERHIAFQSATRLHLLVDAFLDTLPAHLRVRARIIPNTVWPASTPANPGSKTQGPKTLITVARLVARKNLRRLIREFASVAPAHPDWTLRIIGDGPLRAELEALSTQLDLTERVVFLGELGDVYPDLARAHCFVLPSLFEGFPMSSLEAMAHGLPVVGYAACNGMNVQVEHGVNGLLAERPLELGGLAQALDQLMGNAQLRRKMGAASLARYEALYANTVISDQWEALFAEAAAEAPSPRLSLEARLEAALDRVVFGEAL